MKILNEINKKDFGTFKPHFGTFKWADYIIYLIKYYR